MPDFAQTTTYKLPYPDTSGSASDDVPRDLKALALAVEAALKAVSGGGALSFTRVAGVITQAVEARPDGSARLMLLRYSNDRLVSVTRYNPSAVDTLTYDGAGRFTGFTTA